MLVDGCNFAQLTAWAYRAKYFNFAALQVVHYFLKMKTNSETFLTLIKLIFNILLQYLKNLPLDLITIGRYCTCLDIYILQGSVAT